MFDGEKLKAFHDQQKEAAMAERARQQEAEKARRDQLRVFWVPQVPNGNQDQFYVPAVTIIQSPQHSWKIPLAHLLSYSWPTPSTVQLEFATHTFEITFSGNFTPEAAAQWAQTLLSGQARLFVMAGRPQKQPPTELYPTSINLLRTREEYEEYER